MQEGKTPFLSYIAGVEMGIVCRWGLWSTKGNAFVCVGVYVRVCAWGWKTGVFSVCFVCRWFL